MKWPTMDEFAQMVADKAIDEVEYNGKTLREWIEIISATEHGTNLAEVGTDCISRRKAVNALYEWECDNKDDRDAIDVINGLPSIQPKPLQPWEVLVAQAVLPQPEIVRCKDCKYAEYIDDVKTLWCTECGQGRTVSPNDFCSYAKRREVTT